MTLNGYKGKVTFLHFYSFFWVRWHKTKLISRFCWKKFEGRIKPRTFWTFADSDNYQICWVESCDMHGSANCIGESYQCTFECLKGLPCIKYLVSVLSRHPKTNVLFDLFVLTHLKHPPHQQLSRRYEGFFGFFYFFPSALTPYNLLWQVIWKRLFWGSFFQLSDLNPGRLGTKRERYRCAMPSP